MAGVQAVKTDDVDEQQSKSPDSNGRGHDGRFSERDGDKGEAGGKSKSRSRDRKRRQQRRNAFNDVCRNNLFRTCDRANCKFRHLTPGTEEYKEAYEELDRDKRSRSPVDPAKGADACRDFMRGLCHRGESCRYFHPPSESVKGDWFVICHDYEKGMCRRREECRYFHIGPQETDLFRATGKVSWDVVEQYIRLSLRDIGLMGTRPICKDFLKGDCNHPSCRYRHMTLTEYEDEVYGLLQNKFAVQFGGPPMENKMGFGTMTGMDRPFMAGRGMLGDNFSPMDAPGGGSGPTNGALSGGMGPGFGGSGYLSQVGSDFGASRPFGMMNSASMSQDTGSLNKDLFNQKQSFVGSDPYKKDTNGVLSSENASLRAENTSLREQLTTQTQEYKQMLDNLDRIRQEKNEERMKVNELQSQLNMGMTENQNLRDTLTNIRQELAQAHNEVSATSRRMQEYESQNKGVTMMKQENENLIAKKEFLEDKLRVCKMDLKNFQHEITSLFDNYWGANAPQMSYFPSWISLVNLVEDTVSRFSTTGSQGNNPTVASSWFTSSTGSNPQAGRMDRTEPGLANNQPNNFAPVSGKPGGPAGANDRAGMWKQGNAANPARSDGAANQGSGGQFGQGGQGWAFNR